VATASPSPLEGRPIMKNNTLLVVGGGVAGTMAVIAAVSRGFDVTWVADRISPHDQSAHWHGHLHRGRLYDPERETDLIDELSCNASFWWSDAIRPFHTGTPTIAIGPDERWATSFRERLTGPRWHQSRTSFLRSDSTAVGTDEAILDGPAFLDAAYRAALRGAAHILGRCDSLRLRSDGSWSADISAALGGHLEVTAAGVILATGAAVPELVPDEVNLDLRFGARLSRMLVLRGTLPRAAAIVPSRAAGGLFFASREIVDDPSGRARAWLVSDGFSSPGTDSPGDLTDGWWSCSVIERLLRFVREEVLEDVAVSGYLATKFRLASSPAQVPAKGVSVDLEHSFVALAPSKWSTAPTSAINAIDAIVSDPLAVDDRIDAMARLVGAEAVEPLSRFDETWQTLTKWVPFTSLTTPGLDSLKTAASIYQQEHGSVVAQSIWRPVRGGAGA